MLETVYIFSWINIKSHELEMISTLSKYITLNFKYYISNESYIDSVKLNKFKCNNIHFNYISRLKKNNKNIIIPNKAKIIFFNYTNSDNLILINNHNKVIFIWNIASFWLEKSKIKNNIDVYNFYKIRDINDIYKKIFIYSKINNIYNINYPSWIKWCCNIKINYNTIFIFDIIITLWGALDFDLIDKIISNLNDKKIIIIWKNHPHKDVVNNKDLILSWWNKSNISLINMVNENELYKILKISKIWVLPFLDNVKRDITRIADLLYLWKTILTTKIDANIHIDNLTYCEGPQDYLNKITYYLKLDRFNNEKDFIKKIKYYENNFSIDLIIKKVFDKI